MVVIADWFVSVDFIKPIFVMVSYMLFELYYVGDAISKGLNVKEFHIHSQKSTLNINGTKVEQNDAECDASKV
jgi:hypothetical protein